MIDNSNIADSCLSVSQPPVERDLSSAFISLFFPSLIPYRLSYSFHDQDDDCKAYYNHHHHPILIIFHPIEPIMLLRTTPNSSYIHIDIHIIYVSICM